MRRALAELGAQRGQLRSLSAMHALATPEVAGPLDAACPAWRGALASSVALAPAAQAPAFCAACSTLCARLRRPAGHVGMVAFAAALAEQLDRTGGLDPTEQQLLEWLAE
jgi:hypothetical protein